VQLVAPERPVAVPITPDADQQRVIDHVTTPGSGPLLVLAGPGTGKTATVVEAVTQRIIGGTDAERVLVLTFSRKAAGELRDRMAARLGGDGVGVDAWTFHAFCFALMAAGPGRDTAGEPASTLRLLSAPEQDGVLRDLLAGHEAEGFITWPEALKPALTTRGFADEIRRWFAAARALDPARAASLEARPEWIAAGRMLEEYLDILGQRGTLDYDELVHGALDLVADPAVADAVRDRYDLVVVDEYQDTDPAQARLLQVLAGDGRDLVVIGDPDQSIYGFRGADVRAILGFADAFRTRDGARSPVVSLATCRRSGQSLIDASRQVSQLLPAPAGLPDGVERFRQRTAADTDDVSELDVLTFASTGAQYDHVVDQIRREHLDRGTPWSRIAVLCRGSASIASIRRALVASGVPVEVAGDEIPLARDPAIAPLLTALRIVAAQDDALDDLDPDDTHALLLSPLGGLDTGTLRRLGRALRDELRAGDDAPGIGALPSSARLLHLAVIHPERLVAHDPRDAAEASRLGRLLAHARELHRAGGTAYEVLWALWAQQPWRDDHQATWADRLEAAAYAGGPDGRRADRDLDAIVALFDLAARIDERSAHGRLLTFLDVIAAQEIPADSLAERGVRGDAVRVLTAHRSKGLEWDVVCVVDVQEDSWPDLRYRGSVLRIDELDGHGPLPMAQRLAEERRLFYVAVTRARRRLIVTAVNSSAQDGPRVSRFLHELGIEPREVTERAARPLALVPLVADLRRALEDPSVTADACEVAARTLASLAQVTAHDRALVPGAHPDQWWGLGGWTGGADPLYPPDEPIRLSGSSLDKLTNCSLKWFFAHEAKAEGPRTSATGFGSVLHALADDLGRRDVALSDEQLTARLDEVWTALSFDAAWQSERERRQADAALLRLLTWHRADRGRTLIQTEQRFETQFTVNGREVLLRGSMDRVELDSDGQVVVADLKTSKRAATGSQVAEHVQLGVYQVAVRQGVLADVEGVPGGAVSGGAELVQLRVDDRVGGPKVQPQDAIGTDSDTWIDEVIATGVDRLVREDFAPVPSEECTFCPFTASCPSRPDGGPLL
jgi:superfamily I DNA/RNA helicase/RecB family exonuclease